MSLTVDDIMAMDDGNAVKQALLNAGVCSGYDEFCVRVEDGVLRAIETLEKNKPQFGSLAEDPLTAVLAFGLELLGFSADHDNYRNGHCDLVVKEGRYEWYGEAKLDKGPGYVMEGFRQLCDRYPSGGPKSKRGGLIIYTQKRNKVRILDVWIKRIQKDYEWPVVLQSMCMNTLTARTQHAHVASGLPFTVRHFPVSFYHRPSDKAERARLAKLTPQSELSAGAEKKHPRKRKEKTAKAKLDEA